MARGPPGKLDLFYVAADGSLQWLKLWATSYAYWRWEYTSIAEGLALRVDTDLKAVNVGPNRPDVYFVSVDNGLYVVHGRFHMTEDGQAWTEPVEIAAPGMVAAGTPFCVWPGGGFGTYLVGHVQGRERKCRDS